MQKKQNKNKNKQIKTHTNTQNKKTTGIYKFRRILYVGIFSSKEEIVTLDSGYWDFALLRNAPSLKIKKT